MEKELSDRLDKLEEKLSSKKKDIWEKLQMLTPILVPLSIALVGVYFTDQHNQNQLRLQEKNSENQLQVALINSSVGQSELIKGFMEHLTNRDTAVRNIAIEAILYAAPNPGKKIVEIIAKTSDNSARKVAVEALTSKRTDLVLSLFSPQKQTRLSAAGEITSNWSTDGQMLAELIARADRCLSNKASAPDCENGVYNTLVVLPAFSPSLLKSSQERIRALVDRIPAENKLTRDKGAELLKSIQ